MAEETAAATATAPPIQRRNTRARGVPPPVTAAAPAAPTVQPADAPGPWPTDDIDGGRSQPTPANYVPGPLDQPDPAQFERARQVLQDALVAHATGAVLDPDQRAVMELDGGAGLQTAIALRVLAAEARARAVPADPVGRALTDLGIGAAAAHLDLVADRMAARTGFSIPDLIDRDWTAQPAAAAAGAVLDPAVAELIQESAVQIFDDIVSRDLRSVRAEAIRPSAELAAEVFPLELPGADLRRTDRLHNQVSDHQEAVYNAAPQDRPLGLLMALTAADHVLADRNSGTSVRDLALRIVSRDPEALHCAARLRQMATHLDQQFAATGAPSVIASADEQGGWSFTAQLTELAAIIEQFSADPAVRVHARVATLFGLEATLPPGAAARLTVDPASIADQSGAMGNDVESGADRQRVHAGLPDSYGSVELPEHALLGSLLYAPSGFEQLPFMSSRNFARSDTRVLFATLQHLHQNGMLVDLSALPTQAARLDAGNDNRRKLFIALRENMASQETPANIPQLIDVITRAAPPETVPYRGVYDPSAQLRLGQRVFEDSCRRQIAGMGVLMRRPALVPPSVLAEGRGARSAQALAANLETIGVQMAKMTEGLVAAVVRPGPDGAAEGMAAHAVAAATPGRWRVPDKLRMITQPLLRRAERNVLRLALYAGNLDAVPKELLSLVPEDFAFPKHADTWRVIQHLHARDEPVNYVSVSLAAEQLGLRMPWTTDEPGTNREWVLTDRDLKPETVARSLRTLTTASLTRTQTAARAVVTELAANRDIPMGTVLGLVKTQLGDLSNQANTAVTRHNQIADYQHQTRTGTR
jgi:hypothetical protein